MDQMDISGSLEDLQDQNVIVYLLRVFRDKYYSKASANLTSTCYELRLWTDTEPEEVAPAERLPPLLTSAHAQDAAPNLWKSAQAAARWETPHSDQRFARSG